MIKAKVFKLKNTAVQPFSLKIFYFVTARFKEEELEMNESYDASIQRTLNCALN